MRPVPVAVVKSIKGVVGKYQREIKSQQHFALVNTKVVRTTFWNAPTTYA